MTQQDPGLDMRQLIRDDPLEAERLTRYAQSLIRRGADLHAVHAETYIRLGTLYQWHSRIRREALTRRTASSQPSTPCGGARHARLRAR
ncbi:hypothetical protein [Myxococcus landrumensis]|uniref:Transposase n=1 Tax=Myxococcus landrumensis TaxID=2813577 RepID=A0ABX7NI24_9BACT|nr:hypothetical protein [Myxococcus landrumus]QSQ17212.1 hypothetical protein JY572_14620 [Myxococcus landrumus]